MSELQKFLIFLSQFDFTYSKFQQIVDFMGDDISVDKFCRTKFDKNILSSENFEKMKSKSNEIIISNYIHNLKDQDIVVLTKFDNDYPQKMLNYPDAPFFLFCKGDISLLNSKALAIVGTRKPSNYGRVVTGKFASEVASQNITIVSGLAYGVDSISHRKCLEVGGKTIAVLGSGLNEIYPAQHQGLAEEIAEHGLLISEYPPNKSATKYTFPQRNRIIAGLSDGVLITEASFKSGTIHTKDYALEYGKNIYAVPGNIDSPLSLLTNDIIKSGQAICVTESQDILKDYDLSGGQKKKSFQLSMEEEMIVSLLEDGMKDVDFLIKNSNLSTNIFNSYLTTLEIRGIINRLPGGFVALN